MPAKSKKQSRYLNWRFGHAWVKRHHYDTPTGNLPERVKPKKRGKKVATKKTEARRKKKAPHKKGGKKHPACSHCKHHK